MGSKIQTKLDETGVSQKVTDIVTTAADKTKTLGSKLYEQGSEKLGKVQEKVPIVGTVGEKGK